MAFLEEEQARIRYDSLPKQKPTGLGGKLANPPTPDNSYVRGLIDKNNPKPSRLPPLGERLNTAQPNNAAMRGKLGPLGGKYMGPEMPATNSAKSALTKSNMVKNPALSSAPIMSAIGADQYNQAELNRNIQQGNLGVGTGIRGIASLMSRAPQYLAGLATEGFQDNPYLKGAEGLAKKGFEALGDNSMRDSLADMFYRLDPAGLRPQDNKGLPAPNDRVAPSAVGKTESSNQAKYNFNSDQGLYDFVNSSAYSDEMRNAGLLNDTTKAPALAPAPQESQQGLTPQGTYFDQGVEVVPWDNNTPEVMQRLLSPEQFADWQSQQPQFDGYGDTIPGTGKARVNPALNPELLNLEKQRLAMQQANANRPKQTQYGFSDGTLYPKSGPEAQQFMQNQAKRQQRTQNSLMILDSPDNYDEKVVSAARAWLKSIERESM